MSKEYLQLHKEVTWISGMPRSGTTWLSQIFASSPDVRLKFCPLFSYEFKNALDENSSKDDWRTFFNTVYQTESEYLDQEYLRKKNLIPRFINKEISPEHLVIKSTRFHHLTPNILMHNPNLRFIHIVRHPCASIYSWLNNPYEFPEMANPAIEWKNGSCRKNGIGEFWGFSDWKFTTKQAIALAKIYPERMKIIKYEEIVKSPLKLVQEIFDFCGIDLEQQTANFLTSSQNKHDSNKRSVYKDPKHANKWHEHLDSNIVNEILCDIKGTELEQFSLL